MGVQGDAASPPEVPGYELGALLARGGTSEVWAGVALDGSRRVAVKLVHAELGALEAAAREASLSAVAADAHVVPVEASVALPDGRVAVVMPHLLGGALDALVRARGHLSPGEVVTVLTPVASALGRLHDLGVVHGDVSPGNVLLDLDGRPLLGDLGLGHVLGEVTPGVWGTDGYVAPEVLLGSDPTPASDVYALGALGWLCLSGAVPGPPGLRPPLSEVCLAGDGAAALVAVVAGAVSPDPAERPSAHELAWALFGAAEPEPLRLVHGDDEVSAVTYRLRAAGRPTEQVPATRWWQRLPRARRRGRAPRKAAARAGARATPVRAAADAAPTAAPARWRHAGAEVRRGWRSARRRPTLRVARPAALLVPMIVALLVAGVAGLGRHDADAVPRTGPGPSIASGVSARAVGDPVTDPQAPRSRSLELLRVLADARARAWREAAPALLLAAEAPRSPVLARDGAAVSEVRRAALRYSGLRYTVAEVATVSATPRRAVLRARVDAGAYAVTSPAGSSPREAVPGAPVLVDLVFTDVGWRVSDLRPAP